MEQAGLADGWGHQRQRL